MYLPRLSERVKFLKEDEAEMLTISNYFEEREAKAEQRGEQRGEQRAKERLALRCLEAGKMTLQEIADCCELTLKRVQTLAAKIKS